MDGSNFTERLRRVLSTARNEAARLGQDYVAPVHLLLALEREEDGAAAAVLRSLRVVPGELRPGLEYEAARELPPRRRGLDLPYTEPAQHVLELAAGEAQEMAHSYVGTEHLLLGLIKEERSIAARALREVGANLFRARMEVRRLLHPDLPGRPRPAFDTDSVAVIIRLEYADGRSHAERFTSKAAAMAYLARQ